MADESIEQKGDKIALNLDDIAEMIILHPKLRAKYFSNPDKMLARHIPERWYRRVWRWVRGSPVPEETRTLRLRLAALVEHRISGDKIALNLDDIAEMIVLHPKLRAEYFSDPDKMLARHIPERWYRRVWRWVRGSPVPEETRALRLRLAALVEHRISDDTRLISARETYYERESFLKEGMQNPERSFRAVFWMSIAAFVIGVFLLGGGVAAAIAFDDTTQKTVLGGLSGGAGVVTTLLAVFRASSREIRRINGDNAQIRMILTDFATEITHLRAIHIGTFKEAARSNAELSRLTKESVSLIPTGAVPREREDRAQTDGKGSGAGERRQGFLRRFLRC